MPGVVGKPTTDVNVVTDRSPVTSQSRPNGRRAGQRCGLDGDAGGSAVRQARDSIVAIVLIRPCLRVERLLSARAAFVGGEASVEGVCVSRFLQLGRKIVSSVSGLLTVGLFVRVLPILGPLIDVMTFTSRMAARKRRRPRLP